VVFCNCDDPFESNFFKYFAANFNYLGLKKIIATSYKPSPIVGGQIPMFEMKGLEGLSDKEPFKIEINKVPDVDNSGAIDLTDVRWLLKNDAGTSAKLKGDQKYNAGDFRSKECIELLKESDIVCTNPPFSLFREYVAQLMEYGKRFLIIGNMNAITYKESFKFIKENKMWLGYNNGPKIYQVPSNYEQNNIFIDKSGKKYAKMGNTCWYTNLDISKRHELLILYKQYSVENYPKYDNYNAIEVSKISEIPKDYKDVMGVPVTFVDKYNPDQFEILGHVGSVGADGVYSFANAIYLNGRKLFKRILIRNKKVQK